MSAQLVYGLAAQALLVAWIAWLIKARGTPCRPCRLSMSTAAAAVALIPLVDGVSAAMALRALWGDPSVTTLQLLALALAGRPARIGRGTALALGAGGLVFYALALGFTDFDPYRLGYAAWPLAAALGLAALVAWQRGQPLYAWLLTVDLAVYAAGLPESGNFCDALFDPLLVGAALAVALAGPRGSRLAASGRHPETP